MISAENLRDVALLDVSQKATAWSGFLFVPAAFWTPDGFDDVARSEPLHNYTTAYLPLGIQQDGDNILEFAHALWVRARLPVVLHFAPPTSRQAVRPYFLNAGLLAVSEGEHEITPCVLADQELQAELRFGPETSPERRRIVAAAFWGLLASDPGALANYRDRLWTNDYDDATSTRVGYWHGQFHLF